MSEVRIARFVDMKACKSIFSDYSTFVLRSPEHYRRLYETTEGGTHKNRKIVRQFYKLMKLVA